MKNLKKLGAAAATAALSAALVVGGASACTMIYVGANLTDTGDTYFARSEDYSNYYNKIGYVSEHGRHAAGSVYEGCYGFQWTFTHDSYSYTAVRDDNLSGVCPDCDGTHDHTPMEEAGTNEMGVSVTAMVTLSWKGGRTGNYSSVDPMVSGGMCESDMETILLGEAATAREGMELLCSIYDTYGAEERSGVIIADESEAWYVENYTGTQYIAIKLSDDMICISPNMGAIGLVDLDDTENVVASDRLIEVAKEAEYYVGDEEANTIDVRASYSTDSINSRMINGLNFLNDAYAYTSDNITDAAFKISNVAEDGSIVTFYTGIQADREITVKDMINFYKVSGIGNTGTLEYHVFDIRHSGTTPETDTVEWLAFDNGAYNVMVPYYPMLTTDMLDAYQVGGLGRASRVDVKPEDTLDYIPDGEQFRVLPEGWSDGYYWVFTAVANSCLSNPAWSENGYTQLVLDNYDRLQEQFLSAFYDNDAAMIELAGTDLAAAKEKATETSKAMANEAWNTALGLFYYAQNGGSLSYTVKHGDTTEVTLPEGFAWSSDPAQAVGTDNSIQLLYNGQPSLYVTVNSSARSHTVSALPAVAPTCTEAGLTAGVQCSVCGAVLQEQEELPAAGHSYVTDPAVEPTYKHTGLTEGSHCSVCGQVQTAQQVVPALSISDVFYDVPARSWFAPYVAAAYESGLTAGVDEHTFAPNADVTRAMFVTMLYSMAGKPEAEGPCAFADVAEGAYYYNAVIWAAANGVTAGVSQTSFAPESVITREQMVTMLYGYAKNTGADVTADGSLKGYADEDQISDYAVDAMTWAVSNGLVVGRGANTLAPQASITRAEVATILVGYAKNFAAE